jgi:hypothetical protein
MFALIPDISIPTTRDRVGTTTQYPNAIKDHIKAILDLPEIDVEKVKERKFKVCLDSINGIVHYRLSH